MWLGWMLDYYLYREDTFRRIRMTIQHFFVGLLTKIEEETGGASSSSRCSGLAELATSVSNLCVARNRVAACGTDGGGECTLSHRVNNRRLQPHNTHMGPNRRSRKRP